MRKESLSCVPQVNQKPGRLVISSVDLSHTRTTNNSPTLSGCVFVLLYINFFTFSAKRTWQNNCIFSVILCFDKFHKLHHPFIFFCPLHLYGLGTVCGCITESPEGLNCFNILLLQIPFPFPVLQVLRRMSLT